MVRFALSNFSNFFKIDPMETLGRRSPGTALDPRTAAERAKRADRPPPSCSRSCRLTFNATATDRLRTLCPRCPARTRRAPRTDCRHRARPSSPTGPTRARPSTSRPCPTSQERPDASITVLSNFTLPFLKTHHHHHHHSRVSLFFSKSLRQQHLDFPGGHPSRYYRDPTLLNCGDLTGPGAFSVV